MSESINRGPIRYCLSRALPPYSYVPGRGLAHPTGDPKGHSFGRHEPPARALDEATWRWNEVWLYAIDLFNHGYYWEAHEAWEALWHAAGRRGPTADLLKGLIKLAGAGVKSREGRPAGVRKHAARAAELLAAATVLGDNAFGLSIVEIGTAASNIAVDGNFSPPRMLLTPDP
jgi:uncharacterized protein